MANKTAAAEPGHTSLFDRPVQHDAKLEAILSQAARQFNTRGSRATRLIEIGNSVGLAKTSLYYYVKNKEDLIYQCYMATLRRHHQTLDRVEREQPEALARLKGFFMAQFENWLLAREGRGSHTAALSEIAALKGTHREEVEALYLGMFKRIRQYLRDGITDGSLRACETTSTTRAFLGAIPWSFNWLQEETNEDVLLIARQTLEIMVSGFSAVQGKYQPADIDLSQYDAGDFNSIIDREHQNRLKQEAFYRAGSWFFNKKGVSGTSLDEVAEHLNVSKGAFYYYIKSKEDLLLNCYTYSLDIIEEIEHQVATGDGSGLQKLEETLRRIFYVQNSDMGPLIRHSSITSLPIERQQQVYQRISASNKYLGDFLYAGMEDGSIRQVDRRVGRNLLAAVTNASIGMHSWRNMEDIDAAAIDFFDVILNGLLPRQA